MDGSSDSTGLFGLSKGGGGVLLTVIILAAIGLVIAIIAGIVLCRSGADDKGSKADKAAEVNDVEAGGGVPMKPIGDVQDGQPQMDGSESSAGSNENVVDDDEVLVIPGTDVAVTDA